MRLCEIKGCETKHYGRGYCRIHYRRWKSHGDPLASIQEKISDPEKALEKFTQRQGDCLVWTRGKTSAGYGKITHNGKQVSVHRYVWEREKGPIPDGWVIDHICHTPACCNINHLRLATQSQNGAHREKSYPRRGNPARNVYPLPAGNFRVRVGNQHFGVYSSIEEAKVVAEKARRDLFGEFAGKG